MNSDRKKIIYIGADFAACGFFRVIQPVRAFQRHQNKGIYSENLEFSLFSDIAPEVGYSTSVINELLKYDAVVVQRPTHPNMPEMMRTLKKANRKVYVELDDALFHIHPSNPAAKVWSYNNGNPTQPWSTLKECIEICDKLILSTPELANFYPGKEYIVHHNAIDLKMDIYNPKNSRRHQLPRDKKIIGWAGSTSHIDSLQILKKPINKLFKERNDITFGLCSNPEFLSFFDLKPEQKQYIKHKPFEEWPPVMSLFDINLACVRNDLFNSGKSELKVLEAGVWGVPSVCTYNAPYARFNKNSDGGNLLVWENKTNDWVEQISKLIDEPETYQNLVEKTKKAINSTYNLEEVNKMRTEFFKNELN
jgi:glycosyltransferase involved in cell wall biosynthesis